MFQCALMRQVCESTPKEQSSQHLQMTGVTGRDGRHFSWHSFLLASAVQSCAVPPLSYVVTAQPGSMRNQTRGPGRWTSKGLGNLASPHTHAEPTRHMLTGHPSDTRCWLLSDALIKIYSQQGLQKKRVHRALPLVPLQQPNQVH